MFESYGIRSTDLLWTGRPASGLRFHRNDALYVPFSLMWGGFAIFWETMAVSIGTPWFFKLWGIPFVLAGLYMIAGRFFVDAYRRSQTWYGVTSDSALILRQGWAGKLQRLYLPSINKIDLELAPAGTGTITFGDAPAATWFSGRQNWSGGPDAPSFEGIGEAQRVYDLCVKAQRSSAAAMQPA
jgi:hypothetical protein